MPNTMSIRELADYVGEEIAINRHRATVVAAFVAAMETVGVTAQRMQMYAWGHSIANAIVADLNYDSETEMAQRAVYSVLEPLFGATVAVERNRA